MDIYDYLEPASYLKDHLQQLKKNNSAFSLRAWAMQLGMKSHGPLHAILNGQRKIPKSLIPKLIKSLKLPKKEAKYFEVMVDYDRAKSPEEKQYYMQELGKLSPVPLREINDLEAYKYLTDPIHIMMAEFTQIKGFKKDPLWIRRHFRFTLDILHIEEILERLTKLGVLYEEKGKLKKSVEHIYTQLEIKSDAIQSYHKMCSQMAMDQINKQELFEREFNAVAFNIKRKDLPKIKENIREYINQIIKDFEASPHEGDETYQLNLQLFSLTKE